MCQKTLWEINRIAANYFHQNLFIPEGKIALDYFEKRNLSRQTIKKFGLGYSGKSMELYKLLGSLGYSDAQIEQAGLIKIQDGNVRGRFWNRVMFPILDMDRHVIAFGGRVLDDRKPKYLNSPETLIFDKSRNLYGMHLALNSGQSSLFLCEGYMDVIAMHQAGFHNAVASLGTSLTSSHASLIGKNVSNVYLIYDSDAAGINAALRAIPILEQCGVSSKVVHLEPYKDPDEFIKTLGADMFRTRVENAEDGLLFKLRHSCDTKPELVSGIVDTLLEQEERVSRHESMMRLTVQYAVKPSEIKKMTKGE